MIFIMAGYYFSSSLRASLIFLTFSLLSIPSVLEIQFSSQVLENFCLNLKVIGLKFPFVQVQLGNPETCYADDWQGILDYAWSHAIVSEETHKTIEESCDFYSGNQWSDDCSQAAEEVYRQYKEIDMYSLYTSGCIGNTAGSEYNSNQVMVRGTSNMVS